jgi:hypothetical protein
MRPGRKQHILSTTLRKGLKNNSFNAIKVFKSNVTRSQRNGKDNAKINIVDWLLVEHLRQDQS